MIHGSLQQLADAIGAEVSGDGSIEVSGVGIDTREDLQGRLFIAIQGDRHDGHDHLSAARGAGAVAAMVQADRIQTRGGKDAFDRPLMIVDDTIEAMAMLARHHRHHLPAPVIGVTGSAGKTTTRGILEAVLAPLGSGTASIRSFNNHVGVPLTILGASEEDRWVVLEMGTSGRGEIATLVDIASPTIAVVTGTGRAHLEGLGDESAVAEEKATILDGAGLGVVNVDRPAIEPEIARRRRRGDRIVTYGMSGNAELRLLSRHSLPGGGQSIQLEDFACRLSLDGAHNAINAIAAIEVARRLGVSDSKIARALGSVAPPEMRFARREFGGIVVFDDAYNANPESMKASLGAFAEIAGTGQDPASRRIAVLGAMLELGDEAVALHREVGECAGRTDLTHLIVVASHEGEAMAEAAVDVGFEGEVHLVPDATEAARRTVELVDPGDMVLVKGSRGIGLEEVTEALARQPEDNV